MSICIARLHETMTPLMHSCLWCPAKRRVFKSRLKRSDSTAGSRNKSGSAQTVWPASEKARVRQVLRWHRRKFSLRRLVQRRCWQPETSDWHAAVGEVPRSLVPKTQTNSHGKYVLHQLWNRQPVQMITLQPWKSTIVFLGSWVIDGISYS